MRIGSVKITYEPRMPFHPFLRTTYFVESHPLEGPVNVRAIALWLYFAISYNSNRKYLKQAKEMWDANDELRAQAKAAYEKALAEHGDDTLS